MKEQFTVYLEPELMHSLTEYAERRGKPKSLVAEAAIASFLSPDAPNARRRPWRGASTGSHDK
jgi:predicted transcriptional regulator